MTKLTNEELKLAKELSNRLKTQDNRGTATPIWFLLQDVEEQFDPVNGGDFQVYQDEDGEVWRGDDGDAILREILESVEKSDFDDEEEFNSYVEKLKSDIDFDSYGMTHEYVTKRIFLTEEAANKHLKANHYHYSPKARIYVDHAWRDPEMELVYKILTQY